MTSDGRTKAWRRDVGECRKAWRAGRADYDPERMNAMRCRECGALASIEAAGCPRCGSLLLDPAWSDAPPDAPPAKANALACIGCGEVWPLRSAPSCPACGEMLLPVWMEDPPCGPATMEEVRALLAEAGIELDDGDGGAVVPDRAECVA